MNKAGYVIAKNKGLTEFFTSSSAYDRPRWVSLSEATTYPTAELAERASTKLYKSSSSYAARVVSVSQLQEARGRDMSYAEQPYDDSDPSGIMPDGATGDEGMDVDVSMADGKGEMTASKQGNDPSIDPEADDEMGLADMDRPDDEEDTADIENMVDRDLGDEDLDDSTVGMPGEDEDIEGLPDAGFDETEPDFATPPVRESATMPKKPPVDGKPVENSTTANKMKKVPEIDYKDPTNKADKPATDLTKATAEPHEDKVKVPANVMKELRDVISEFERAAKFANTRDDAKAEFCMTVVEAFRELEEYLKIGNVESLKLAQVHYTSLMNAISNHLPEAVKKFIMMGGRKPTLKDLFDSKRGA